MAAVAILDLNHPNFLGERYIKDNRQSKKPLPNLTSDQEVAMTLPRIATEESSQELQRSLQSYLVAHCNDPSGQGVVHLMKLLRAYSLPFEKIANLRDQFMPSFFKMNWKHAVQLWPQYKVQTDIPEYDPAEPYIPISFATEVFRAIEKAEMDIGQLSDPHKEAKVVAWTRAILVEISNLFSGAVNNAAEGYINDMGSSEGRIEFKYMVLEVCVIVVLQARVGGVISNNYAQMMAELEGCDMQNRSHQLNLDTLQGVLSSPTEWYFWAYDGKNFTGYCSALRAFIRRSEERGFQNSKNTVEPITRGRKPALRGSSQSKAFSAEEEQDFAVVKILLNQSFDASHKTTNVNCDFQHDRTSLECIERHQRSKT
ncbi:hypothetical protein PSHT_13793 [Puccinia striiformis]|uniref:Uncharacterized protein n=1 Tax=Puccinia striiformis TaxID=27350 RepID=A0A2S4UP46_9BASI|nr:hypothetical protein PSHT_13793 [Puccinia striiformis]